MTLNSHNRWNNTFNKTAPAQRNAGPLGHSSLLHRVHSAAAAGPGVLQLSSSSSNDRSTAVVKGLGQLVHRPSSPIHSSRQQASPMCSPWILRVAPTPGQQLSSGPSGLSSRMRRTVCMTSSRQLNLKRASKLHTQQMRRQPQQRQYWRSRREPRSGKRAEQCGARTPPPLRSEACSCWQHQGARPAASATAAAQQ
jgi:hypothetical protein